MKRIIYVLIILFSATLSAMEKEKASNAQEQPQQPSRPSTVLSNHITKNLILDYYRTKFLRDPANDHNGYYLCEIKKWYCYVVEGWASQTNADNNSILAVTATLNLVNSIKLWISTNLQIQAFGPNELTLEDVWLLMDKGDLEFCEAADCMEIILRFICVYYPEKAIFILGKIGFEFYFLCSNSDSIEQLARTSGESCSELEFTRKYFEGYDDLSKSNFLKTLYQNNHLTTGAFFDRDLFKKDSMYQFPVLFHDRAINCFTIQARHQLKPYGFQQIFIAKPGIDNFVGWVQNRETLCPRNGPAFAIAPVYNPSNPHRNTPKFFELQQMGKQLRQRIERSNPSKQTFSFNGAHVVCSLQ